jgi:F-type H+-transporting ATPase subunit c
MMKKMVVVVASMLVAAIALAEGGEAGGGDNNAWYAMAAAFAIAIPAFAGAFGQGRAASAALEGIARNPGAAGKLFVPMILGLALIESLVIYGLVIAFVISGKIA